MLSGLHRDSSYRYEADKEMYVGMQGVIKSKYGWWNPYRWILMSVTKSYYSLVLAGGRPSFVYREDDAVVTLETLRDELSFEEKKRGGPLARCRHPELHP